MYDDQAKGFTVPVCQHMKTRAVFAFLLISIFGLNCLADEPPVKAPEQISVNVLGVVNRQSRVTLPSGSTILDALASAGGMPDNANLAKVRLIHKSGGEKPHVAEINVKKILAGTAEDVVLQDGDTVDVQAITMNTSF